MKAKPHYLNHQPGCTCFDAGATWHEGAMAREYHLEPNPDCPTHFPVPEAAVLAAEKAWSEAYNAAPTEPHDDHGWMRAALSAARPLMHECTCPPAQIVGSGGDLIDQDSDPECPLHRSPSRYEYTAAVRHVSGFDEPVGVTFSEDTYLDAKQRALGEYHAWKRDSDLLSPPAEVVFLRRPVAFWEAVDVD